MKQPIRGSIRAATAYLDYLIMHAITPRQCSLARLAKQYQATSKGVPTKCLRTLEYWSSAYHWQQRIAEHDAEVRAAVRARRGYE